MNELDINGCENLANAIVKKAFDDYKDAIVFLKKFELTGKKRIDDGLYNLLTHYSNRKRECERFFKSKEYSKLTSLDCDYVINKIDGEFFEDWNDFIKQKINSLQHVKKSHKKDDCIYWFKLLLKEDKHE